MLVGMMLSEPTETDLELPGRRLFSLFIFLCVSFSSRVLFPILIRSLFFTLFLSNPLFVSSSYSINAVDCGSKPNYHFSKFSFLQIDRSCSGQVPEFQCKSESGMAGVKKWTDRRDHQHSQFYSQRD